MNESRTGLIARQISLRILQQGGFLKPQLYQDEEYQQLSPRDKALVMELVHGVTKQRRSLQRIIKIYSHHRRRQHPDINTILQLGLYQLLFLERIPAHAAIHASVALVKKVRQPRLAGYVNALLRHIQRDTTLVTSRTFPPLAAHILPIRRRFYQEFQRPVFPDPTEHPCAYLAAAYSYPHWLVKDWWQQFGSERTPQLLLDGNQAPGLSLRPNKHRCPADFETLLAQQGLTVHKTAEGAWVLEQRYEVRNLPGFEQGWFSVQGPAAMAVAPLLDPQPGEYILDLCAAPGGKTTHLAELMGPRGWILACDIALQRLQRLQANYQRLRLPNISLLAVDAGKLPPTFQEHFDRVLLDAPCSNTAVLARRAEARWRISPATIQQLTQLQATLLHSASQALKPGGILVYATCSLQREENQELIHTFLQHHPAMQLQTTRQLLPHPPALDGVTMFRLQKKPCPQTGPAGDAS